MNTQQIRYAINRVDAIEKEHLSKISDKDFKSKGKRLTDEERLKLLKAGKVKFRERDMLQFVRGCGGLYRSEATFPGETPDTFDEKGYRDALNAIRDEATRIRDGLVLGNEDQALKALKAFEKFGMKVTKK